MIKTIKILLLLQLFFFNKIIKNTLNSKRPKLILKILLKLPFIDKIFLCNYIHIMEMFRLNYVIFLYLPKLS